MLSHFATAITAQCCQFGRRFYHRVDFDPPNLDSIVFYLRRIDHHNQIHLR